MSNISYLEALKLSSFAPSDRNMVLLTQGQLYMTSSSTARWDSWLCNQARIMICYDIWCALEENLGNQKHSDDQFMVVTNLRFPIDYPGKERKISLHFLEPFSTQWPEYADAAFNGSTWRICDPSETSPTASRFKPETLGWNYLVFGY